VVQSRTPAVGRNTGRRRPHRASLGQWFRSGRQPSAISVGAMITGRPSAVRRTAGRDPIPPTPASGSGSEPQRSAAAADRVRIRPASAKIQRRIQPSVAPLGAIPSDRPQPKVQPRASAVRRTAGRRQPHRASLSPGSSLERQSSVAPLGVTTSGEPQPTVQPPTSASAASPGDGDHIGPASASGSGPDVSRPPHQRAR
jgi:hypothetical protein